MKALLLPICLVACLGLCIGQSQKTVKPDLSGTWEFDARGSSFKSKNSSPEQITITHHDPELIIRRKVNINGVSQERDLTYYTDGRAERNQTTDWITTSGGSDSFRLSETLSKTTWSKDKIVTRSITRSYAGGTEIIDFEIIDELRLSSDGKMLTKTTRFVPPKLVRANVWFGRTTELKTVYKLISK